MRCATRPIRTHASHQRGVYAIEFALVFVVFFAVIYATLAYGIVLTIREGLQFAAEEGARAGLRYPVGTTGDPIQARRTAATNEAQARSWLAAAVPTAYICQRTVDCNATTAAATPCTLSSSTVCQIVVTVTYDYGAAPLIPSLPGLQLLLPNTLTGRASVLLNAQTLSL